MADSSPVDVLVAVAIVIVLLVAMVGGWMVFFG